MARAHSHWRERPDERVVDYAPALAPVLEASRAPRAGALLEQMYWQHGRPGQERQESQIVPTGQALKPAHHLERQGPSAVKSSGLITPESREQVRVAAIGQVRTSEESHHLVDYEIAHADAVCLGEAADVAGQALGFR